MHNFHETFVIDDEKSSLNLDTEEGMTNPTVIYCGRKMWNEPALWKVANWWLGLFVLIPLATGYAASRRNERLTPFSFFSYFWIHPDICKVDEGEKACYRADGRIFILISGVIYALTLFFAFPFSMSHTTVLALWIAVLVPAVVSWVASLYIVLMMQLYPPASIPILMFEGRTYKFMTRKKVLIENVVVQMS